MPMEKGEVHIIICMLFFSVNSLARPDQKKKKKEKAVEE